MAVESWCSWPLSAWLSSGTACFLFFNAIVCLVAALSWGRGGGDATLSTRRKRLTRSASSMVMERLRVMSTIFSFHSADEYNSITPSASQLHHVQYYTSQKEGAELFRQAASEVEPEPAAPAVESMAATVAPRTPSAPVAVAAEVCAAASKSGSVKEMSTPAAAAAKGAAMLERPRKWKVADIAERRAFADIEEKAEVNARADRFIRQFWEDLKLECLNSILTGVENVNLFA